MLEKEIVWSDQEHFLFMVGLKNNGKDFIKIQEMIKTKTVDQLEQYFVRIRDLKDPSGD